MKYYRFHKPYGFLSQFTPEGKWQGLKEILNLPPDVYPLGRLDADSEGLLLLTNDKSINQQLLNPKYAHLRKYIIQVEGEAQAFQLGVMTSGIELSIKGKKHFARAAHSEKEESPSWLEDREPPVRVRKSVPDSWISMTLTEGKNRQVRRMTAAVGLPTLRLIRWSIEDLSIEGLKQGEIQEIPEVDFKRLLRL